MIENGNRMLNSINVLIPLCKYYGISDDEVVRFYNNTVNYYENHKKLLSRNKNDVIETQRQLIQEHDDKIKDLQRQLRLVKNR